MRLLYKSGPMESLRKWFYKPKRDDRSLLAQFYFADDALNMVAAELDSFDGRKDPERCTTLVNQLRHAQDRVLNITSQIMDQVLGDERVARGFRVKFPEDVLQDNLAGQLWFGAECLAAGSSIMNHEEESAAMRPLAKALTRSLETVRSLLREQCLRPRALALSHHDDMLHESLRIFDRLFAEFELCYVSAMVPVKTPQEFEAQQCICVLFSESLDRALKQGLLTQEQVDSYDPALMFAVPRLAIVSGLLIYSTGPLSIDKSLEQMSDMFRPFRALLNKIRSLLWTLDRRELVALERLLCTNEDIANLANFQIPPGGNADSAYPDIGEFVSRFYADHAHCRDLYTTQQSSSSGEQMISENDYLPDNIEVMTPIIDGLRRLGDDLDEVPPPPQHKSDDDSPHSSQASDSASTDTFQTQESLEKETKSRKTSRKETTDMSSLRNLSTNGLMMFDPLVINAVTHDSSTRLLPDQNLVTSLNEQVTEIADRLSSIMANEAETPLEHNQMHSFSTSDVPSLVTSECAADSYGFSAPRTEQVTSMPSTSHGYLIPNAISQEPVVLAALSHNNSAVFNQEDETGEIQNAILNSELPLRADSIEAEIVNTNITLANANLSSLLLTNEEFRQNFLEPTEETSEGKENSEEERVKFMLGYESDGHEISPGDSGVSTENTSLDRSPDTDVEKENHYMKQNRVLRSPVAEVTDEKDSKNLLENSFSDITGPVNNLEDVVVNINYIDNSDTQFKNEACSSDLEVNREISDSNSKQSNPGASRVVDSDLEMERRINLQMWGIEVPDEEYRSLEDVIAELKRQKEGDKKAADNAESVREVQRSGDSGTTSTSETTTTVAGERLRQRKARKMNSKTKSKKKMWSPGRVLLDNRASQMRSSRLKLNLDRFVDESGLAECADDEEIALALQAQELAARQQARAKFKSSEDLIHRLFVCIAGVADQLQTNFAADLRNILKSVFLMNQTPETPEPEEPEEPETPETETETCKAETIEYEATEEQVIQNGGSFDSVYSAEEVYADSNSDSTNSEPGGDIGRRNTVNAACIEAPNATTSGDAPRRKSMDMQTSASTGDLTEYRSDADRSEVVERAPEWIPDIAAPDCMWCSAHFTAFRRRHHCRNCGKVFCASCSSNSVPLPRFGQPKPVRVCDECFTAIAQECRRAAQTLQR